MNGIYDSRDKPLASWFNMVGSFILGFAILSPHKPWRLIDGLIGIEGTRVVPQQITFL